MEQHALKNENNCLNTNIYCYLETSGGQSSNPYLIVVLFSTPEFTRNLWQLQTAVFLHWCLLRAVPLFPINLMILIKLIPFKLFETFSSGNQNWSQYLKKPLNELKVPKTVLIERFLATKQFTVVIKFGVQ